VRKALAFAVVLAVSVGAALYFGALPTESAKLRQLWTIYVAPAPATAAPVTNAAVPVVVAAVRAEDVPIYLSGIGTVQAYNSVAVKSRVDGEITQILFTEGQMVQPGTPLAIIDPRPFQAQLQQQVATRAKDQALLDGAVLDQQRYDNLVKKDFASRQQVDQQRALVEQSRAQLQTDDAQIAYAQNQLGYTTLRSPIAGRAGIRLVDQGNSVHAADNTVITVITQLQPISVVFTLPADAVARSRLSLGQVHVPVLAFASDDTTKLDEGFVELVDNQVDQATGTIKLKAQFPNAETRLWPGNFVNGRLIVAMRHDAPTVPASAVRHGPRGDFTWVVGADDTVEARTITVGQIFGGRALILTGLKRGERVVTEGQFRLEDKTRVSITRTEPDAPARGARAKIN
jgi:multidrug efflux system membrane fusion protein